MSDFNLEVLEFQLASEVVVKDDGKATFSIRAVARLAGVSESSLRRGFEGAALEPTKMAVFLTQQGFEGAALEQLGQTRIPDLICAAILEYYAFEAGKYCTKQAKQIYRVFARIGIRAYAQHIAGWKPQQPINYEEAIIKVLQSQIPETLLIGK